MLNFLDVIALAVLLLILTLPVTSVLVDRWGFEEAGGHNL